MKRKIEQVRLRRLGRRRLAQFQRVKAINDALQDENWLRLNELLDIDYALVAKMT
jgi:hypothetical protein